MNVSFCKKKEDFNHNVYHYGKNKEWQIPK